MLEAAFETSPATLQILLAVHTTNAAATSYRLSRARGVRKKVRLGCEAQQPVYTRSHCTLSLCESLPGNATLKLSDAK